MQSDHQRSNPHPRPLSRFAGELPASRQATLHTRHEPSFYIGWGSAEVHAKGSQAPSHVSRESIVISRSLLPLAGEGRDEGDHELVSARTASHGASFGLLPAPSRPA